MRHPILLVFFLATGCVGQIDTQTPADDDDQPPPGESAKTQFVQNVYSITARCSGAGCHNIETTGGPLGHFYAADANQTYDAITAAPTIVGTFEAIAPIITKIDAGHQNVTYSDADRTAIQNWLAAELAERQDDPTAPPPVDPVELLKAWSGCMTIDNFTTAQMPEKFGGMAASTGQACRNCHSNGGFGFTDNDQAQPYFDLITTSMSQNLKYFSVAQGKVVINMGALTNAGVTIVDHPRFDPMNNLGMPALQQFYDLTLAAQTAAGPTGCGPAKIINP